MSRFDALWRAHEYEIRKHWHATVSSGDLVLIPGDFSWADNARNVEKHLAEINGFPGRVVISPGNHDRWWKKTERLQFDRLRFLNDSFMPLGDEWTIAATIGYECPESPWWKPEMQPKLDLAVKNLDQTLALVTRSRPGTKILLMLHYPPRWDATRSPTAYEEVIARYPVELVVYGHIHGQDLRYAHNGHFEIGDRRVRYENASCDRILFKPIHVLSVEKPALSF